MRGRPVQGKVWFAVSRAYVRVDGAWSDIPRVFCHLVYSELDGRYFSGLRLATGGAP